MQAYVSSRHDHTRVLPIDQDRLRLTYDGYPLAGPVSTSLKQFALVEARDGSQPPFTSPENLATRDQRGLQAGRAGEMQGCSISREVVGSTQMTQAD